MEHFLRFVVGCFSELTSPQRTAALRLSFGFLPKGSTRGSCLMNRSASRCDLQTSWSTEDDEPSGGNGGQWKSYCINLSSPVHEVHLCSNDRMGWTRGPSISQQQERKAEPQYFVNYVSMWGLYTVENRSFGPEAYFISLCKKMFQSDRLACSTGLIFW